MGACKVLDIEEHLEDFADQNHMDHVGEFHFFSERNVPLMSPQNLMVAPFDADAHIPLLVHLKPSDMGWKEKHAYVPPAKKIQRKERRKDIQKQNKRKGFGGGGP